MDLHYRSTFCLSSRIHMNFDIHGYGTRETGSMNVHLPTVQNDKYSNSYGKLWYNLPGYSDFETKLHLNEIADFTKV